MSEIVKYDGRDIATIDIEGRHYVAMKPIVEGMGLDWVAQWQIIQRDEVLNAAICVTQTTGADGKRYEMVCLPLDYLNGWLFKVPASRYKGERREKLIQYQRECYKVLSDYFAKGGAVNPAATAEQLEGMVGTIRELAGRLGLAERQLAQLQRAGSSIRPQGGFGERSRATGEPRIYLRRAYWRSSRRPNGERNGAGVQLMLELASFGELPPEFRAR